MDITVSARKMQLTDPLKEYVEEKLTTALGVFSIDPLLADVVLHVEKNRSNPNDAVAEITVRTKRHVIRAEEAASDMYAAIDLAADKVERQLRKYKTKIVDRRQQNTPAPTSELNLDIADLNTFEDGDGVVRTKIIDIAPLSEDEAMLEIDLLGHDFFMYRDPASGEANVIYRRHDGGYGILKPKSA